MHLLIDPRARLVHDSPYTQEQALKRLLENLDFIASRSSSTTMRLATEIVRESFSPTWSRMPGLLAQLHQHWDVSAIVFGDGVDSALWLPNVLWLNGQDGLVRALAERQAARDPLSPDAWYRRFEVEVRAGDLDAAQDVLLRAREHLGPAALKGREIEMALRRGDRATFIRMMSQLPSPPPMVIASVEGAYATAKRLADERVARLSEPPGQEWQEPLGTYNEIGATEAARKLVKGIDDSFAGTAIFVSWIGNNPLFFDINDAPNFVAKLKQAGIDPASLPRMPRLSALP
jgi:hypothetical protein